MLNHETKDIFYVMDFPGHRDIRNTMRYIQLEKALFNAGNDQFHVKVAKNVEDACALVEVWLRVRNRELRRRREDL